MQVGPISKLARATLQRFGFDLITYRSLNTILSYHKINVVFDVGANVGQHATMLREIGYKGKIVSFEPQRAPFEELALKAAKDPAWTALNVGLGREEGQKEINIYTTTELSSMLTLDLNVCDFQTQQVGTETIQICTVDDMIKEHSRWDDRVLLKIDTQGFEKEVLLGAEQSLSRLVGVQMEMSLTPLYAGQPLLDEMITFLRGKNFMLWQIKRGICKKESGQEMEIDGIFIHQKYAGEGSSPRDVWV